MSARGWNFPFISALLGNDLPAALKTLCFRVSRQKIIIQFGQTFPLAVLSQFLIPPAKQRPLSGKDTAMPCSRRERALFPRTQSDRHNGCLACNYCRSLVANFISSMMKGAAKMHLPYKVSAAASAAAGERGDFQRHNKMIHQCWPAILLY